MTIPSVFLKVIAQDDSVAARSVPYDQANSLSVLDTGNALSLVDIGSGVMVWRQGGTSATIRTASSTNAAYTSVIDTSAASGDKGLVMIIRGVFIDTPAGSTTYPALGWLASSNDEGVRLRRNGGNGTQTWADWRGTINTGSTPSMGSVLKTAVIRFIPNRASDGLDELSIWMEGTSGDAADQVATGTASGNTLNKLAFTHYNADVTSYWGFSHWVLVRPTGGANSVATDYTDAVCRSIATDLAAALAAAGGPTINTQTTAQTANEGATATFSVAATTSGGTLHYQWKRQPPGGGAFSNVGTDSNTYTTIALDCATDHGAQFYCTESDDNGAIDSTTVGLTVRSVTTTSRPAADVTTAGWTASTGAAFFALLDETSASDADYITSPAITVSTAPVTMALAYPMNTGTRTCGIRAKTSTGTATMRVYLLNDAGTVVGTSADQTIISTYTTYSLPITLSGPATRARVEIVT